MVFQHGCFRVHVPVRPSPRCCFFLNLFLPVFHLVHFYIPLMRMNYTVAPEFCKINLWHLLLCSLRLSLSVSVVSASWFSFAQASKWAPRLETFPPGSTFSKAKTMKHHETNCWLECWINKVVWCVLQLQFFLLKILHCHPCRRISSILKPAELFLFLTASVNQSNRTVLLM